MTYQGYRGEVNYSDSDGVFYGKVYGINDLVTFEGTSVQELKKAFKEAVDDYLETCESIGKKPEKEYKGSFNVRVSSTIHRKAANYAQQQKISLNKAVERALRLLLSENSGYRTVDEDQEDYGSCIG